MNAPQNNISMSWHGIYNGVCCKLPWFRHSKPKIWKRILNISLSTTDTISPPRLIERLVEIGVEGTALSLLSSFLVGRTQVVTMGSFDSEPSDLISGVPQGSALSPTLFNVYVSPLAKVVQSFGLEILSYADDTQIMVSISNDTAGSAANFRSCMEAVACWMSMNFLKLNGDKTEVLIFGPRPDIWSNDWWPSSLGTCPVPVTTAKNLGVLVDNALTMNKQVARTVSTCFGFIRIVKKIAHCLPVAVRKQVMSASVLSRLDYCNSLYLGINKAMIHSLQTAQNAAARLVLDLPKHQSVSASLTSLHWLKVQHRIHFKVLCIIHKTLGDLGPESLKSLLSRYVPTRALRSRDKNLLIVPRFKRARWGGRSFSVLAPKLWNSLPVNLSCIISHSLFRKSLKTFLFSMVVV